MKHSEASNILHRFIEDGYPVNEVYDAKSNAYIAPLANLILDSARIEARAKEPWIYKSLAHWGEETFILKGHIYVDPSKKQDWVNRAIHDFSYNVCVNILYEEDEGLMLFVKEGETFRQAQKGDPHYDYICRLRADAALFDLKFTVAPTWASEIFIQHANYEAYKLLWHDLPYTNQPAYADAKRVKAEAVRRETQRLLGKSETSTNEAAAISSEIDPADLPEELSAANIAYRAVTKGYGDPSATFKNRLIGYLEKNFVGLNTEAVQRIATVANPDKAPGRRKRNLE